MERHTLKKVLRILEKIQKPLDFRSLAALPMLKKTVDIAVKILRDVFAQTLKKHTNEHARRGRPTLKNAERQYLNESFSKKQIK